MPSTLINGIDLYYDVQGDGPPVLFIHGLGSSARDWEPQVADLRDHYRCIAYDARGHGRSGKPPGPYSVRQHALDATELLEHLEIPAAAIIGVSMGGMIALQLAVDIPERVTGMVIINSGPHLIPGTLKEHLAIWQRLILFRALSMRKIGEVIAGRLFPGEQQSSLRETFAARWAENDKRAYMDATRGLIGWTVLEHLPSIHIPTLAIAADQDYTPVETKQAFVEQMPDAELVVVEQARHAMCFDQPEKINPLLEQFLARIADRRVPA